MPQDDLTEVARAQKSAATTSRKVPRIVVLGGGSVGLYSARRIRKRLGGREAAIVVVDPRPYMTYQPFLPEVAAGSIDGRHGVAPLRRAVKGVDLLQGLVTHIDHAGRRVTIQPESGDAYTIRYDHLVVGLGAVSRTLPIPGLAETAIGFKTVEEAVAVRNQVLNRIDVASSTWDPDTRRRMLTFVFVGGGFAGVEAIGEVESMARAAVKYYPEIDASDLRFVLVEGSPRILPEVSAELGGYTLDQLRKRDMEIYLSTFLSSCVDGHIVLSNGQEFEADTVVWTAGVKANPVLKDSDLPLDQLGRVTTNAFLQVVDADGTVVPDAWAAGDCAAVPDLVAGGTCPPNAQHAIRQANRLGENLAKALRSVEPTEYRHKNVGAVASLGMYQGVAQMFGRIKVRGWFAWVLHRTYHVMAMPTWNRKIRIMAGWTGALFLRREVISLGSIHDPRAAFRAASQPPAAKAAPTAAEAAVTTPDDTALATDAKADAKRTDAKADAKPDDTADDKA